MSNIITVTTDFGLEDYFVGVMKGVILSINPDAKLVDLNNKINRHDIMQACISLRTSCKYFPSGSVHLVVVDPGVGSNRRPVAVESCGQFFVGPDNGVFSFLYDKPDSFRVHEITNSSYMLEDISSTFHGRDIFAPAAAYLSMEQKLDAVGPALGDPVSIKADEPEVTEYGISGKVVYRDTFGNLITNIRTDMVENGDEVRVPGMKFSGVSKSYAEADKGEPLVVAGSSGYLEIAVNLGDASRYFGNDKMEVEIVKKNQIK